MRMRVIAGSARRCILQTPAGFDVRPTADRVKEALFASLGDRVAGSRFLDLFGGTGAIGIEALSRGAERAVFVDISPACVKLIERNLIRTKLIDKSIIINDDALRALRNLSGKIKFDIAFLDPPYDAGHILPALNEIVASDVTDPGGLIIAECGPGETMHRPPGLEILKRKKYRTAEIIFYGVV